MLLSGLLFVGSVFYSLVSFALSGFYKSVVAVGYMSASVESASAHQWLVEE